MSEKDPYLIQCLHITKTSKNIIAPLQTKYMKVLLVGGGGGGGDFQSVPNTNLNGGGGGGGAGTFVDNYVPINPGDKVDVIIGHGGQHGQDGEDTILIVMEEKEKVHYELKEKLYYEEKGLLSLKEKGSHCRRNRERNRKVEVEITLKEKRKAVYHEEKRKAHGGKYGSSSLSGGFGGAGGAGSKDGAAGKNGDNGTPLIGGMGGISVIPRYNGMMFGDGGKGGSIFMPPTLAVPPKVNSPPCGIKFSQYMSKILSHVRCEPKCETSCIVKCDYGRCVDCGYCPPNVTVTDMSPQGNPGIQGYAEIRFYTTDKCSTCSCEETQIITPSSIMCGAEEFIYYVDSAAKEVVIDTFNKEVNVFLPSPPFGRDGKVKLRLKNGVGLNANITTSTGGTYTLTSTTPQITLIFLYGVWDIFLPSMEGIHSFYPTTQQGPVISPNVSLSFSLSGQIAISADGNTIAWGIPSENGGVGAVYIYVRENNMWHQEARLVGDDYVPIVSGSFNLVFQGYSVSLTADGNMVAFGGIADSGSGAVWVFKRCKEKETCLHKITWKQEGHKIMANAGGGDFGNCLALTADGKFLFVCSVNYGVNQSGAVIIFKRKCESWQQIQIILSPDPVNEFTALCLAISADGTTLAVKDQLPVDIVNVYTEVLGVWVLQQAISAPPGGVAFLSPNELSLSADGNTLAIGDPSINAGNGGAHIWVRNGTSSNASWTFQQTIAPIDSTTPGATAIIVSLSADGNTLALGGPNADFGEGTVWIFTRVKGSWYQREKLTGATNLTRAAEGYSVALSSEGTTLAVSNLVQGSVPPLAWIFI